MESKPFRREGQGLVAGSVAGYAAFLLAWTIITNFAQDSALTGAFARSFTFLILPLLLLIPGGLSLIVGILTLRCQAYENESASLQMAGLFAMVISIASSSVFVAFYFLPTTMLYLQPHVIATAVYPLLLGIGNLWVARRVSTYDIPIVSLHPDYQ